MQLLKQPLGHHYREFVRIGGIQEVQVLLENLKQTKQRNGVHCPRIHVVRSQCLEVAAAVQKMC